MYGLLLRTGPFLTTWIQNPANFKVVREGLIREMRSPLELPD